jgi:hypothetical protein
MMRRLAVPLLLFTATPSLAQSPAALMACVRIGSDADRLACFDREMANASPEARVTTDKRTAEAATAAAAAAVAAKARAEADAVATRDAFGAETLPKRADRPAASPAGVEAVETAITEMLTNASGLGVFLLDNGQLWKQVDTGRLPNPRVGDRVTLTRTNFGGYHLNFVRQKSWVLVKRVR